MTLPLCIVCHGKVHNRDFLKIKELQKVGIEKANKLGKYKGSTKNSSEKWIQKPKNSEVVKYLKEGYQAKEISKIVGVHVNTITKIKKYLSSLEKSEYL
jgi:DNA invertase Pin-like site-specific DNA recombinase